MAACMRFRLRNFSLNHRVGNIATVYCSTRFFCKNDSDSTVKNDGKEGEASNETKAGEVDPIKTKSKTIVSDKSFSKEKQEAASKKLLSLLSEMSDPNMATSKPKAKLNLAKPNPSITYQKKTDENFEKNRELEKELGAEVVSAVKEVASTVAGDPEKTKSELTLKLLSLAKSRGSILEQEKMNNVADIVGGMKIEKVPTITETGPEAVKFQARPRREHQQPKIDIFDAQPLNIFHPAEADEKPTTLRLWKSLQDKELKLLTYFAPRSPYEEMIRWTEEGKHWKFPIDNDADVGAEEKVGFHEHVFLEKHLHGFPTKGPVRHFMELVCVGLSKNPYITVERKIENIDWFRQYFNEKEGILRDYGVLDS